MNDYWEKMGNTSILGNHQMSLGSFHVEKMMRSDDSPVKKPGGMMATDGKLRLRCIGEPHYSTSTEVLFDYCD